MTGFTDVRMSRDITGDPGIYSPVSQLFFYMYVTFGLIIRKKSVEVEYA